MAEFRVRHPFLYAKYFFERQKVVAPRESPGSDPVCPVLHGQPNSDEYSERMGSDPLASRKFMQAGGLLEKRAELLRWFGGDGPAGEVPERAGEVFREVQFPRVEEL